MGDRTKIEWTDASWTPIRARYWENAGNAGGKERIGWHCEHVTEACRNCYAESMNLRLGTGLEFKPGHLFRQEKIGYNNGEAKLFLDPNLLVKPLHWKKPRKIFVCSMTDLFADFVPDEWIDAMFAVMALTPQHTYQVLTKRPARMRAYLSSGKAAPGLDHGSLARPDIDPLGERGARVRIANALQAMVPVEEWSRGNVPWPLKNVWLGTSIANQDDADKFVPDLIAAPAAIRFLSCEPMLGPINLREFLMVGAEGGIDFSYTPRNFIQLVICGGESGRNARPMHPDWARSLRDQCASANTAFFFKQWGEWDEVERDSPTRVVDWGKSPKPGSFGTVAEVGDRFISLSGHVVASREAAQPDVPYRLIRRVGKKKAGRLLDGVEHNAFPEAA